MKLTFMILPVFLLLFIIPQAISIKLSKRRFGQEHTPKADATYQAVKDIVQGTNKEEQAGNLSGAMVRALLAKAPTCDQQDRADEVIDLAYELGGEKKNKLIQVAKTYRQLERNTPQAGQSSELCKKAPRHKELVGLVQAQDPTGKSGGGDKGEGKSKDKHDKVKHNKDKNDKDDDDDEECCEEEEEDDDNEECYEEEEDDDDDCY